MIYHNSQDTKYRDPSGAVTAGTRISLSLHIQTQEPPEKCFLRLWNGETEEIIPMYDTGQSGLYECTITVPDTPLPLWYYFIIDYHDRTIFYGNNKDNLGGIGGIYEEQPPSYQITVYRDDYKTPEWFRKGTVYHIFVDRFSRSDKYEYKDRYKRYHENWYEQPFHTSSDAEAEYFPDDFFGGNLQGIIDRLDYIHGLGVATIYLSPIFESRSNHKYDTGDYTKIDSSFGNEAIFRELCQKADSLGIRIMLDGVFSHTGDDSKYFNKYRNYDSIGAYNSKESEYYPWYTFEEYPDTYKCWWDVVTMPTINKESESFCEFICGDDGIAARWLRTGASGWRLDVADELPMEFLEKLRKTVKKTRPDALLLGEVWEDASNKVAYGSLRNYCHGDTLDSVMNYPIREALIDFIMGGVTSEKALALLGSQLENYPEEFLLENMNLLGSHDRTRLRTVLSGAPSPEGMTRDEQAGYKPEAAEASFATARVKCLAAFMFTMPGVPHIYYGDEAGLEGMADPFNRKCYPWGNEDKELIDFFRKISLFRKNNQVLINGETEYLASEEIISCKRTWNGQYILALFNRNKVLRNEIKINLSPGIKLRNLFTDEIIETGNDVYLTISPGPLEPIILYYV